MAINAGERLADFVCEQRQAGVPAPVLHGAKRLLLNQLTASAAAALLPAGAALLAQANRQAPASLPDVHEGLARLWWSGAQAPPAQAAAVNAQLLGLLDLGDTHLPSLGRFTAAIVPFLLAQADVGAHEGRDVLEALALGLEVDIACAGMAVGASLGLGAAVARCTLLGLERTALASALNAVVAELGIPAVMAGELGDCLPPGPGPAMAAAGHRLALPATAGALAGTGGRGAGAAAAAPGSGR